MWFSWLSHWKTYAFYYLVQMIVTISSMAFYGVMAFTPHMPCVGEYSTSNTASVFVVMFIIGFAFHAINFIVAGFVEPNLRIIFFEGMIQYGLSDEYRQVYYWIESLEFLFRFLFICFSLF